MKLIGIGSNLPSSKYGPPAAVVRAALGRLDTIGLRVLKASRLFVTAPVPVSDQPWYVNCAAAVDTAFSPHQALAACMAVEAEFGRIRSVRNAARILDLDILAWDNEVIDTPELIVPHPRLADRAFVLFPLADLASDWRHPVSGETIGQMAAKLPPDQQIRPLDEG